MYSKPGNRILPFGEFTLACKFWVLSSLGGFAFTRKVKIFPYVKVLNANPSKMDLLAFRYQIANFLFQENKSNGVQISDAFWRSALLRVSELSWKWFSFVLLMLFCFILVKTLHFTEIQFVSDRPTDERTDGRTDTPSYRDARTHLKKIWFLASLILF